MPTTKTKSKTKRMNVSDQYWDRIAKRRDNKKSRYLSHSKAWKTRH